MLSVKQNKTHLKRNAQLILLIQILKVRKIERLQRTTLRLHSTIIDNPIPLRSCCFHSISIGGSTARGASDLIHQLKRVGASIEIIFVDAFSQAKQNSFGMQCPAHFQNAAADTNTESKKNRAAPVD